MKYQKLGHTELNVSRICFGALGIGPLQAKLPVQEGAAVIRYALESGINFIDTAEMYETYDYIFHALKGYQSEVIIATKSYAYTSEMMKASFEKARKETGKDYIDIFLLHEQESEYTIKGHREALDYLLTLKEKGLVKAVGISTHHIAGVQAATLIPEIDIIHPLINMQGLGIADGGREEMEDAIAAALKVGKGIYAMKALGGGNLINNVDEALKYAYELPVHAVALGMKSFSEVDYNISYLEEGIVREDIKRSVNSQKRKLIIEPWCKKCSKCVARCSQKALTVAQEKIIVNPEKCVLCGYCSAVCEEFCIKIV